MGTAEQVIGAVTGDRSDVRITAKVGSPRPAFTTARTVLRAAKRLVAAGAPLGPGLGGAAASPGAGFDFDAATMARSLERSLRALRRERVDALLLHEGDPAPLGAAPIAFLAAEQARGRTGTIGVATGARVQPGWRLPAGWVAQAAVDPALLTAAGDEPAPAFLHGIGKTVLYLADHDARFARWLHTAAASIPPTIADPLTARLAVGFARLHAHAPASGLIFASIGAERLAAFLRAVHFIDAERGAAAFAGALPSLDPRRAIP